MRRDKKRVAGMYGDIAQKYIVSMEEIIIKEHTIQKDNEIIAQIEGAVAQSIIDAMTHFWRISDVVEMILSTYDVKREVLERDVTLFLYKLEKLGAIHLVRLEEIYFSRNDKIYWDDLDGEIVAFNSDEAGGSILELNEIGADIWRALDRIKYDDIVEKIFAQYDVDKEVVKKDVYEILQEAISCGIVYANGYLR